MDLLQLRLHRQPADVGLQVRAVHHADAEHDERDVLGLRAHQAAPPPPRAGRLVGRGGVLLLVLEDHFAERLRGPTSTFCGKKGGRERGVGGSVCLDLTAEYVKYAGKLKTKIRRTIFRRMDFEM